MEPEERLDALERAHNLLAAQHTALMQVCRMMLPLISADPNLVRRGLLAAYDATNDGMQQADQDDAFQHETRHWLDLLTGAILAAADISARPGNPGEDKQP